MFATGIENSVPTIDGGKTRMDEMESCGHYQRWREDFALVTEMGLQFLRYGPPIHTVWQGPEKYEWSFVDETFAELKARNIVPIVDLCHFGVPDWIGNFQNPDFPVLFADYARAFAKRLDWCQLYTPINEMYICAMFSAKYGWWNEQLTSDRSFVTALKNIVKANVLAMQAIIEVRPDAIFIQSESSEYFHAANPAAIAQAEHLNEMRFLSLDLNYGKRVDSSMYQYLLDNGMTRDEYDFFPANHLKQHCIMGAEKIRALPERMIDEGGHNTKSRQQDRRQPVVPTRDDHHRRDRLDQDRRDEHRLAPGQPAALGLGERITPVPQLVYRAEREHRHQGQSHAIPDKQRQGHRMLNCAWLMMVPSSRWGVWR